jgi:hypothetical protein
MCDNNGVEMNEIKKEVETKEPQDIGDESQS